jgi:hypothetical protein
LDRFSPDEPTAGFLAPVVGRNVPQFLQVRHRNGKHYIGLEFPSFRDTLGFMLPATTRLPAMMSGALSMRKKVRIKNEDATLPDRQLEP